MHLGIEPYSRPCVPQGIADLSSSRPPAAAATPPRSAARSPGAEPTSSSLTIRSKPRRQCQKLARKRVIDWYAGTLVSRLNDKEHGPIVVVMQRLHENDLAGHLLDQGGWEHLDLPAIAVDDTVVPLGRGKVMTRRVGDVLHPERESKDALDRIKAEIGSLMFSAQYQQRPIPLEGNLVRRDWFQFYDVLPKPSLTNASCRVGTPPR